MRCECTVEADGVRYNGASYRSLSSAAMAASKDLGLGGRAMNGFLFWGLIKQPVRETDPIAALEHAWERYRSRTFEATMPKVADQLERLNANLEALVAELRKQREAPATTTLPMQRPDDSR